MILKLAVISTLVVLFLGLSVSSFVRHKDLPTSLQLFGAALLLVMVFTHVAERFDLLAVMSWGRPDSMGHYLDLTSAIGGLTLLSSGTAIKLVRSRLARR